MIKQEDILYMINNPVRQIKAKVEVVDTSTNAVLYTFYDTDNIKGYTIERAGESKFFGYGVKQKLNLKLLDTEREFIFNTKTRLEIFFCIDGGMNYYSLFPYFYITETHRDEITGELSITAYDRLDAAAAITTEILDYTTPCTIGDIANNCGLHMGLSVKLPKVGGISKQYVELVNYDTGERNNVSFTVGSAEDYVFTEGWGNITVYLTDAVEGTASFSVSEYGYTNVPEVIEREYGAGILSTFWKAGTQVEIITDGGFSYVAGDITVNSVVEDESFKVNYEYGINIDGTETIEEILTAIAEATQTIYFINSYKELEFKRIDNNADAIPIGKELYFTLDSKTNRRLTEVCSITELGDNVSANTGEIGTTQYIRDNPFFNTAEGASKTAADMVLDAIGRVGGLTINQFSCDWRGNPLLEVGDMIALTTKDNAIVYSFLLNDVITYDGAYKQKTEWEYTESEKADTNPATLGDALKETFARVDKANKKIELLVSETNANSESISTLQLDTKSISAAVSRAEETANGTNEELAELTKKVDATITAEDVQIQIQNELNNGVDKVITSTGFTFNDEGLTVSTTDSEITTTISEDGMQVFKNNEAVLTANNAGVNALNLHATTYLIIGENSRIEDFKGRTACFWIGG